MEQTFKDYEAILIDDGSYDDSAEFCDEFCKKDDRFVVIHQENEGVSCARNKGLEESQGKYVCFIDSDDYVKEEYLETLITSINEENADLSIGGVEIFTEKGIQLFTQQQKEPSFVVDVNSVNYSIIAELLENRYFNYVYAKLYLRDVISDNNIKFNNEVSLGEDTLFVIDYLKYVNKMIISGRSIYTYIKYASGNLTSVDSADKYIELMQINSHIEEIFVDKRWNDLLILKIIDERQFMCVQWAIENAERKKYSDRIEIVRKILKSEKLEKAINRSGNDMLDIRVLILYRIKSAKIILLYRKMEKLSSYLFRAVRKNMRSIVSIIRKLMRNIKRI